LIVAIIRSSRLWLREFESHAAKRLLQQNRHLAEIGVLPYVRFAPRSCRSLVERLKLASPCSPAIRLRRDEEFASSWGDRQGLAPTIDFVLPANDEPAAFELRHHEGLVDRSSLAMLATLI
jgi:hypothetical protein